MKTFRFAYSVHLKFSAENPKSPIQAQVPALKGCTAQGKTLGEALDMAEKATRRWLLAARKQRKRVPKRSKNPKITLSTVQAEWMTVGKVSKTIGVSPATVRKIVAAGDLTAYKFGNEFRIKSSDLSGYMADARVK